MDIINSKVAIVGLGYVGLPLATAFSASRLVYGFDIDEVRIGELLLLNDRTMELSSEELDAAFKTGFEVGNDVLKLKECSIYIVTVPTPINAHKQPELTPLINACRLIGGCLEYNDIVIFESTVYPGATEEVCVPILEDSSGLELNSDFFCAYSPERINPGDKIHNVTNITKVVGGSTKEVTRVVSKLYKEIVNAEIYEVSCIKVAEAAKVIENTQRDVNIALANELALIFHKLGIDTEEVLRASETKWNFIPFRPGLVGGHCIGVDPYYLTHKAIDVGYHPEIILAGRRINDGMGEYVANQITQLMTKRRLQVVDSNILVMGLTFKENCPDVRNTKVIDVVRGLELYNCNVDVYDPWTNAIDASESLGLNVIDRPKAGNYNAIILAVKHDFFLEMGIKTIRGLGASNCIIYDIKYFFDPTETDGRL